MATLQWSVQRSMTSLLLLLLLARAPAPGHASSGAQLEELLPSDVPLTMMDRINSVAAHQVKEPVELLTKLGTITGLREETLPPHFSNTHMHSFKGIPYAESPIGDLRLSDPADLVGEWPGKHLNATKFRSFCPQFNVDTKQVLGDEDCLFLNVYTPSHLGESGRAEGKLLPVFAFIHGGAFLRGSSSSHGAQQLLSRDVVVVTFNYRLGALGFLSTGDSVLPGNYGMLDQISALRWVQRNIAQFGGDPGQVTIGGFSAGSASVHFHMASPLSENLFHRGIMMSGSANCRWSVRNNPLTPTRLLAGKLGCPTASSQAISKCLSSKTVNQIVTAQASIHLYEFNPIWFTLVVDGGLRDSPFLPAPFDELVLRPIPTILGSVPNEGLMFTANIITLSEQPRNLTAVYEGAARLMFSPWPNPETEEAMKDQAESFYYNQHARTSAAAFVEQVTEVITDYHFTSCVWEAASSIAETGAPVYKYLMTHRDPETPTWASPMYDRMRALGYDSPILQTGVSHGDDLIYIFTFPYGIAKGSERDQRVNQILLQMITNFIISGLPQEDMDRFSLGDIPKWEQVKPHQPVSYYNIAVNPSMVHTPFRAKEQNFWKSMVPGPTSQTMDNLHEFGNPSLSKESHLREASHLSLTCSSSPGLGSCH